ncbi:hypothetical protein G3O08_13385 [Cryomorpha ignava]|uniref:Type II CBASS E2 protein domain-containing protein n=1 Tax=Cryomorpha ignava TaxID=101383 RepID=A0A7K3WSR2_9FLAO|nr:hypothetical protein [Cryomorpha ignava]NEN24496.1 hypothetical protein [Cryomorpha ignava]
MSFFKKKYINPLVIAHREMKLLNANYSFLECKIQNSVLYCYGSIQPTEESITYDYRIRYIPSIRPTVTVTNPIIVYNDDIHMYPADNSLCLYHSSDLVWNSTCHLYNTIIPWTHEWFVFYELYKITGRWLHPFVPHKKEKKK